MSRLHIIYLPGLGDRYDPIRRACLKAWRLYGVKTTMVSMSWRSDETYVAKRARVETALDKLAGERVVLIGESAGGSIALSIYGESHKKFTGVMTLCGKNTRSDNVQPALYTRNPAFRESMHRVEAVVRDMSLAQRRRFISVVPWYDPIVPIQQTLISNCQKMSLPIVGHLLSIFAMLTIYAPFILHRAKKL